MLFFGDPQTFIIGTLFLIPALILGFTLHEMAHAYVAVAQGDLTPKVDGRLSPDPRRHIDAYGLLMVILLRFGYAKPVMINPARLRGEASRLLVALAGPFTNLAIAVAASVPLRLLEQPSLLGAFGWDYRCTLPASPLQLLTAELFYIYVLNLYLMVFNLLPVPPLDGFEMIRTALARRNPRLLWQIESNRQAILLGFFVIAFAFPLIGLPNVVFVLINAIVTPVANLLGIPIPVPAFVCG